MALTIVLSLGIIVVIVMAIHETHLFRRNRSVYLFRRLTLRLSMAGMLLFLFASILLGVHVFGLTDPVGIDLRWAVFWGCILLLVGAICCLALADMSMIREDIALLQQQGAGERADRRAEIAEIIAQYEKKGEE